MAYYRFISGKAGIYEAVDRDCPRDDDRRKDKPDGSWLPKIGPRFPEAVSFWTEGGLYRYLRSGLQTWHRSVVRKPVRVIVANHIDPVLHEDEFQVICKDESVRSKDIYPIEKFISEFAYTLERVDSSAVGVIQSILDAAPQYSLNTDGISHDPNGAHDTLTTLPPGCMDSQKHVLLMHYAGTPIGVADVIQGIPDPETAFIGLMVLREDHQRSGMGKAFYKKIEDMISRKLNCKKVRLAVVDSNPVTPFWEKMGFKMTESVRPHEGRNLKSIKRVMEKLL